MTAFALGMEGLVPEAIREMEGLRSKHEVELAVAMALLYFHGKAKMVDRCNSFSSLCTAELHYVACISCWKTTRLPFMSPYAKPIPEKFYAQCGRAGKLLKRSL